MNQLRRLNKVFSSPQYAALRSQAMKQRSITGPGKSDKFNTLYLLWSKKLRESSHFDCVTYLEFFVLAQEDAKAGHMYGLECLFRLYSYGLEVDFRSELYKDFEALALAQYNVGGTYGLEKFWAFHQFRSYDLPTDHDSQSDMSRELHELLSTKFATLKALRQFPPHPPASKARHLPIHSSNILYRNVHSQESLHVRIHPPTSATTTDNRHVHKSGTRGKGLGWQHTLPATPSWRGVHAHTNPPPSTSDSKPRKTRGRKAKIPSNISTSLQHSLSAASTPFMPTSMQHTASSAVDIIHSISRCSSIPSLIVGSHESVLTLTNKHVVIRSELPSGATDSYEAPEHVYLRESPRPVTSADHDLALRIDSDSDTTSPHSTSRKHDLEMCIDRGSQNLEHGSAVGNPVNHEPHPPVHIPQFNPDAPAFTPSSSPSAVGSLASVRANRRGRDKGVAYRSMQTWRDMCLVETKDCKQQMSMVVSSVSSSELSACAPCSCSHNGSEAIDGGEADMVKGTDWESKPCVCHVFHLQPRSDIFWPTEQSLHAHTRPTSPPATRPNSIDRDSTADSPTLAASQSATENVMAMTVPSSSWCEVCADAVLQGGGFTAQCLARACAGARSTVSCSREARGVVGCITRMHKMLAENTLATHDQNDSSIAPAFRRRSAFLSKELIPDADAEFVSTEQTAIPVYASSLDTSTRGVMSQAEGMESESLSLGVTSYPLSCLGSMGSDTPEETDIDSSSYDGVEDKMSVGMIGHGVMDMEPENKLHDICVTRTCRRVWRQHANVQVHVNANLLEQLGSAMQQLQGFAIDWEQ